MFEQGLSFLLKKILRDFVEDGDNLNDKVQVGVWSGLIVLEDLVLKNSIFNLLEAPIVLNYGYIGRFELQIPWSRLGYEPVTVVLDKVYILVEPKYEWNPGAADKREQAMKQTKLAAAELFANQRMQELSNGNGSSGGSGGGYAGLAKNWFMSALLSKIVDKIQFTVRELHVRYEDKLSCPSEFCVGFSFESLHLLSREGTGSFDGEPSPSNHQQTSIMDTERNYEQELKIEGVDAWHKLAELNHLAVYWNPLHDKGLDVCSCSFIGRSTREIQTLMSRTVVTRVFKSYERPRHHYILNPVDIKSYIDATVNVSTGSAKARVKVLISDISICLEDQQLREIISMAINMTNFSKLERFSEYRPICAVLEDPKAWWRYAINAVLIELRLEKKREFSLKRFMKRARDKAVYVELWRSRLVSPASAVNQLGQVNDSLPLLDRENNLLYQQLLIIGRKRLTTEQRKRRASKTDLTVASSAKLADSALITSGSEIDLNAVVPLDTERIQLLQQLEYDLSFEDILFFRSLADLHAPVDYKPTSWTGNIMGWITGKPASNGDEDRGKLMDALKYDPDHLFRGGAAKVDLNEVMSIIDVHLKEGSVVLSLSAPETSNTFQAAIPFLQFKMEKLSLKTITMGDGSHIKVYCALQDFEGFELHPANPRSRRLASPSSQMELQQHRFIFRRTLKVEKSSTGGSESNFSMSEERSTHSQSSRLRASNISIAPLFSCVIETFPAGNEIEMLVKLNVEELEMWLSPSARWIDSIAIFSSWPEDVKYWSEMEMKAMNQMDDLKSRVNAKLDYMMNNHSNIVIEGKVQAPILVIHDHQPDVNCKASLLVVDLGLLTLSTQKLAKAQRTKELEVLNQVSAMMNSKAERSNSSLSSNKKAGPSVKDWEILRSESKSNKDHFPQDLELLFDGVKMEDNQSVMENPLDNTQHRRSSIFHKYGEHPGQDNLPGAMEFDSQEEELFDIFISKISHIEVYFVEAIVNTSLDGKWNVQYEIDKTVMVERFEINVEIQVSALPWDITLPPLKLFVDIPEINIELSDAKILRVIQFVAQMMKQTEALSSKNQRPLPKSKQKTSKVVSTKPEPTKKLVSLPAGSKPPLSSPATITPNFNRKRKYRRSRGRSVGDTSTVFSDAKSVLSAHTARSISNTRINENGLGWAKDLSASNYQDALDTPFDNDSDDGSFFSVVEAFDDHEDDEDGQNKSLSLEELKFVIAQREAMHTNLLTDLRLSELDPSRTAQRESLKRELTAYEMELHQLKVSYVELLMNSKDQNTFDYESKTTSTFDHDAFDEHVHNMLEPDFVNAHNNHNTARKRDMIQASVFRLSAAAKPVETDLSKGPNKELFYMRVNIAQINVDLLCGVDATDDSSSIQSPSAAFLRHNCPAFESRLGLTNFGIKLRHRSKDTKLSTRIRDVIFSEQLAPGPKMTIDIHRPLTQGGVPLITSDPSYFSTLGLPVNSRSAYSSSQSYSDLLTMRYEISYGSNEGGEESLSKHCLNLTLGYLALNFDQQRIAPLILWSQDLSKLLQATIGTSKATEPPKDKQNTAMSSEGSSDEEISDISVPVVNVDFRMDTLSLSWLNGPQPLVNATFTAMRNVIQTNEHEINVACRIVDFSIFDLSSTITSKPFHPVRESGFRLGSNNMIFGRNALSETPFLEILSRIERQCCRSDDETFRWMTNGNVKVAPLGLDIHAAFLAAVSNEISNGPLLPLLSDVMEGEGSAVQAGNNNPNAPSLNMLLKSSLGESCGNIEVEVDGLFFKLRLDDDRLQHSHDMSLIVPQVCSYVNWGEDDVYGDIALSAQLSNIEARACGQLIVDPFEISMFAFIAGKDRSRSVSPAQVYALRTAFPPDTLPTLRGEEVQLAIAVSPIRLHVNKLVVSAAQALANAGNYWAKIISQIWKVNSNEHIDPLHLLAVTPLNDNVTLPSLWFKLSCNIKLYEVAAILEEIDDLEWPGTVHEDAGIFEDEFNLGNKATRFVAALQNISSTTILPNGKAAQISPHSVAEVSFKIGRFSLDDIATFQVSRTILSVGDEGNAQTPLPSPARSGLRPVLGSSFVSGQFDCFEDGQYCLNTAFNQVYLVLLADSLINLYAMVESLSQSAISPTSSERPLASSQLPGGSSTKVSNLDDKYAHPSSIPLSPVSFEETAPVIVKETEKRLPHQIISFDAMWMEAVSGLTVVVDVVGIEVIIPTCGESSSAHLSLRTQLKSSLVYRRPSRKVIREALEDISRANIDILTCKTEVPYLHIHYTEPSVMSQGMSYASSSETFRVDSLLSLDSAAAYFPTSPLHTPGPPSERRRKSLNSQSGGNKLKRLVDVDATIQFATYFQCKPNEVSTSGLSMKYTDFWRVKGSSVDVILQTKLGVEVTHCQLNAYLDYRPLVNLNTFFVEPLSNMIQQSSHKADSSTPADNIPQEEETDTKSSQEQDYSVATSLPMFLAIADSMADVNLSVKIQEAFVLVINDALPQALTVFRMTALDTVITATVPYPTRPLHWIILERNHPQARSSSDLQLLASKLSPIAETSLVSKSESGRTPLLAAAHVVKRMFTSSTSSSVLKDGVKPQSSSSKSATCFVVVNVTTAASIEYFNRKLLAMEPLVEPLEARLTFQITRSARDDHGIALFLFNADEKHIYREGMHGLIGLALTSYPVFASIPASTVIIDTPPPQVTIKLDHINVNVTMGLLENVFSVVKAVDAIGKMGCDDGSNNNHSSSNLVIRNDSGMPIRYWSQKSSPSIILTSCEEPLELDDVDNKQSAARNLSGQQTGSMVRSISLAVQKSDGNFGMTHKDISLEGVGYRIISSLDDVDSSNSSSSAFDEKKPSKRKTQKGLVKNQPTVIPPLVLELTSRNGSKLLVIRSTMRIFNSTNTAFHVRLVESKTRSAQSILWECYMPPGRGSFIPAELCSLTGAYFMISARPRKGEDSVEKVGSSYFPIPVVPGLAVSSTSTSTQSVGEKKEVEDIDMNENVTSSRLNEITWRKKILDENNVNKLTYSHWINFKQQQSPSSSSNTFSHGYHDSSYLYEKLSQTTTTSLCCNIAVESYGMSVRKNVPTPCMIRNIKIMAPIQLINLLANDILITLLPDMESFGFTNDLDKLFEFDSDLQDTIPQYYIRPGESKECLLYHTRESFHLSIKYSHGTSSSSAKVGWSKMLKISGCSEEASQNNITYYLDIPFKNESILTLCIDMVDKGGCRTLSVYTPYWIISTSFLPLQFQHDTKQNNQEDSHLNGVDGLAADQFYEETPNATMNMRNKKANMVTSLPRGIGRARGSNGILLGPEAPIKGLSNILYSNSMLYHRSTISVFNSPMRKTVNTTTTTSRGSVSSTGNGGGLLTTSTLNYQMSKPVSNDHIISLDGSKSDQAGSGSMRSRPSKVGGIGLTDSNRDTSTWYSLVHCGYSNQEKRTARIRFRHRTTQWSKVISIDALGVVNVSLESVGKGSCSVDDSNGSNTINSPFYKEGKKLFSFGISIQTLDVPYHRTQAVVIVDQFTMINKIGQSIQVKQYKQDNIFTLHGNDNNEEVPLWWRPGDQLLQIRLTRYGWMDWSGKFSISSDGEYPIRLRNNYDNTVFFIMIFVAKSGPKVTVTFKCGDQISPYRFENHTVETFRIQQHGQKQYSNLLPYHSCVYAWDEPLAPQRFTISALKNAFQTEDDWREIGTFSFERLEYLPSPKTNYNHLVMRIIAHGPTRVCQIFDSRLGGSQQYHFRENKKINNNTSSSSSNNSNAIWMTPQPKLFSILIDIDRLGISLVDQTPEELIYIAFRKIVVNHSMDRNESTTSLTINRLQIDNQLWATPYPSILHPLLPLQSPTVIKNKEPPPFIKLDIRQSFEYPGEVIVLPEFAFHIERFDINLEGTIISKLATMVFNCMELMDEAALAIPGQSAHKYRFRTNESSSSSTAIDGNHSSSTTTMLLSSYDFADALSTSPFMIGMIINHQSSLNIKSSIQHIHDLLDQIYHHHHYHHRSTMTEDGPHLDEYGLLLGNGGEERWSRRTLTGNTLATYYIQSLLKHYRSNDPAFNSSSGAKIYFQRFSISEIRFNVSFNPVVNEVSGWTSGLMNRLLIAIGSPVVKIDNCSLSFPPVVVEHVFASGKGFADVIYAQYSYQAIKQALLILFSLELIGNPIQLIQTLSEGIWDFMYLPLEGLSSSPKDFLYGLLRGTSSLGRKVIASVCSSLGHCLSSVQVGLIAVGAVDSYPVLEKADTSSSSSSSSSSSTSISDSVGEQDHSTAAAAAATAALITVRERSRRPSNTLEAMNMAITGLISDPIAGYNADGWRGLLLGSIKGSMGLFTRPLYGFLGVGSLTLEQVSFLLLPRYHAIQKLRLTRARPPRYLLNPNQPLQIYSGDENAGLELLSRLGQESYRLEQCLWHTSLDNQNKLLMTNMRIMILEDNFESVVVVWQCPTRSILSIDIDYSNSKEVEGSAMVESEQNMEALFRMLNVHPRNRGNGGNSITRSRGGDGGFAGVTSSSSTTTSSSSSSSSSAAVLFGGFKSKLIGQPELIIYHQSQSDGSQRDRGRMRKDLGLLLGHRRILFNCHEQLLQLLYKLLRNYPSLASADILSYLQAVGVDPNIAMSITGSSSMSALKNPRSGVSLFDRTPLRSPMGLDNFHQATASYPSYSGSRDGEESSLNETQGGHSRSSSFAAVSDTSSHLGEV